MMTPVCHRLLNMINDFVLLRFLARAPEDLCAIEVIYIIIIKTVVGQPGQLLSVSSMASVHVESTIFGMRECASIWFLDMKPLVAL